MNEKLKNQPISRVTWVSPAELHANDWNPNSVAPPELDLIEISIREDGWTQPIVALKDGTIVDGFHRWTLAQTRPEFAALTNGQVPVAFVNFKDEHRMMSTIRHNRARGSHAVLKMAEIIRKMLEDGVAHGEIMRRLQMEDEEVDRLADRAGMKVNGSTGEFKKAWVPN